MDPLKLFEKDYLFDPTPGSAFAYIIPTIIFFLLLLVGSFYIEQWIKKHPLHRVLQETLPNIGGRLRVFGMIGFILLWIRYENLPYLSMRFFLLLYLLSILLYLGLSLYHFKTELPYAIDEYNVEKKQRNYLPKKKRR